MPSPVAAETGKTDKPWLADLGGERRQRKLRFGNVDLVQRDEHRLLEHVLVVGEQLGIDDGEVLQRIATLESTRGVEHVDEHLGAPHVTQELQSESDALGGAGDETGNVGHDERLAVDAANLTTPSIGSSVVKG